MQRSRVHRFASANVAAVAMLAIYSNSLLPAQVTVYQDPTVGSANQNAVETAFLTDSGATTQIDFNDQPGNSSGIPVMGDEWLALGAQFSATEAPSLVLFTSTANHVPHVGPNSLWPADMEILLPTPRTAVGFWIIDSEQTDSNESIDFFSADDDVNPLVSVPMPATGFTVGDDRGNFFVGVISDTPIARVLIVENDGDNETIGIDSLWLLAPPPPLCITDYPGTGEDLFLGTGVNMFPTIGDCFDVKIAEAGDFISLWLVSLGGTFDANPPIILAQAFPTDGTPPMAALPGLHVDFNNFITIVNGSVMTPLGWAQVIAPPGSFYNIQVPPGLDGMSVIVQGGTLGSNAANGAYATTDAHELQIVPGG